MKRKPVAPKPAVSERKKAVSTLPWWLSDDVPTELKPLQASIATLLSPFTAFLREQQRAKAKIALVRAPAIAARLRWPDQRALSVPPRRKPRSVGACLPPRRQRQHNAAQPRSPGRSGCDAGSASHALTLVARRTKRGLLPAKGGREAVEAAVDQLAAVAASSAASGVPMPSISATWRLTWTSEKETLFLLRYGIPFVGAAGESYQVIDTAAGTLANVIEFGDKGAAFVVDSRISGDKMPKRVDFRFTAAQLRRAPPASPISLPPFGAGYFENLYVDDTLRVARDSRGDTLVVERAASWSRD